MKELKNENVQAPKSKQLLHVSGTTTCHVSIYVRDITSHQYCTQCNSRVCSPHPDAMCSEREL